MAFEGLSSKLSSALSKLTGRGKLTEQAVKEGMRDVRMALLEADVNYLVVKDFCKKVTERCVGQQVLDSLSPAQQVMKIVSEEMAALMGSEHARLTWSSSVPTIYMLCGLQGAGKTTMAGKLANYLQKQGKKPLLAACDIYRPAAIKQLQVVGSQVNVPVYEHGTQDPVKTAQEAIEQCRHYGRDVLIIDTAGRLQIDTALMEELRRIKAEIKPQEILFVVDAMTGQEAVNVAKTFDSDLGIDGVILTKLDGDTRGGAALSIKAVTGKPIKFSGTGEKLSDIEPFYPDRMASRILGMGDMMTLIEKAQEAFDEKEAEKLVKRGPQELTLEDFLSQMQQMKKMGGLQSMLSMLPGANKLQDVEIDENALKKPEAIIRSMTPRERRNPGILNASRRKRIAAGSGTTVQDVNALIRQFDQAKDMMKKMMGNKMMRKGKRRFPF
ncbi:MAG: signal recognition particle protein [Candidatus Limiplasma sp.]|jgi:signal recognition particle subunit SRP54|nr:signal recognition particle protein [Clostridiales bacterium]MDY4061527.1 signal recognition particle protein [Candidatus Limiplasma sp.]